MLLPLNPWMIRAFGDHGFTYLAHLHDLAGTPWGTVTAHTTGVFAIMRFPHYMPETYWKLMLGNGALALVIGSVLGWVASRFIRDWVVRVLFVLGSVWLFWLSSDSRWLFLVLCLVLFMPDFRRRRVSWPFLILTLMAAFAFHVKGTFAIAALGALPLLLASELRVRRWPVNTSVFVAGVFTFNALGHSTPAAMWDHLRYVLAAIPCYPEAFSHPGPWRQWLLFVLLLAAFEALLLAGALSRRTWTAALQFLTYSFVLWLIYRTSFTRHDPPHAARAFSTLLVFAASYCFVNRRGIAGLVRGLGGLRWQGRASRALEARPETPSRLQIANEATPTLGLASQSGSLSATPEVLEVEELRLRPSGAASRTSSRFSLREWFSAGSLVRAAWLAALAVAVLTQDVVGDPVRRMRMRGSTVAHIVTEGTGRLRRRHRGAMKKLRRAYPLPGWLEGPAGVFGMVQTPLVAHGIENDPMPVVATYEIWNEEAARRTDAWLRDEGAPRYLLYTTAGSSARNQVTLAENYETVRADYPSVLRRRETPVNAAEALVLEGVTTWGRRLAVPAAAQDGVLMLRLRYRRTWLNRLLTAVHQPPLVMVVLYQDDRVLARIRVNRHLVDDGLILNTKELTHFDARPSALLGLRHDLVCDLDRELARDRSEGRRSDRSIMAFSIEGGMPRDDGVAAKRQDPFGDRFTTRLYPATSWEAFFEPEIELELVRIHFPDAPWARVCARPRDEGGRSPLLH